MNSGKLIIDNGKSAANDPACSPDDKSSLSITNYRLSIKKVCAACGARAARDSAKYCRVCGKYLAEDYEPLDNLRASYNLQRKHFAETESPPVENTKNLFETNENSASTFARAFAIYALVPYLGILFCPGAILLGAVGILTAYRKPALGGRQTSRNSIFAGAFVFAAQIFLWWLLYFVPELKK